jgi:hypothetical protein
MAEWRAGSEIYNITLTSVRPPRSQLMITPHSTPLVLLLLCVMRYRSETDCSQLRCPACPAFPACRMSYVICPLRPPQAVPDSSYGDFKLAVDYVGDAARIYFGERLLTDNWYSGYKGEGAMEVGLNYLAGENQGLLDAGTILSLWILPLKKSELETKTYLQKRLWPSFPTGEADPSVLR